MYSFTHQLSTEPLLCVDRVHGANIHMEQGRQKTCWGEGGTSNFRGKVGTILEVFQKIVTFDLRAGQGEMVGTVFLEVGTARKKALRLDCCSMCSRNWREVGRAGAECVREKRGSERGQK